MCVRAGGCVLRVEVTFVRLSIMECLVVRTNISIQTSAVCANISSHERALCMQLLSAQTSLVCAACIPSDVYCMTSPCASVLGWYNVFPYKRAVFVRHIFTQSRAFKTSLPAQTSSLCHSWTCTPTTHQCLSRYCQRSSS